MIRNAFVCFAVVMLLGSGVSAQREGSVVLSPVPFLTPDGSIPKGFPETGVFLDPKSSAAKVFYRSVEGGPIKEFSIPLSNAVRPQVATDVRIGPGGFVYEFTVANAPEARQSIARVALFDARLGEVSWAEGPSGWHADRRSSILEWTVPDSSNPGITAGKQAVFRANSSYRPGLLRAVVQARRELRELPPEMPRDLLSELRRVLDQSFNSRLVLVFGPKYAPTADRSAVAGDLLDGMRMLAEMEQIHLQSPFVASAKAVLEGLAHNLSPDVRSMRPPLTDRERDLDRAIRLALDIQ